MYTGLQLVHNHFYLMCFSTFQDDDEDEFEYFQDEEEFEGFDAKERPVKGKGQEKSPELKITKVPTV